MAREYILNKMKDSYTYLKQSYEGVLPATNVYDSIEISIQSKSKLYLPDLENKRQVQQSSKDYQ